MSDAAASRRLFCDSLLETAASSCRNYVSIMFAVASMSASVASIVYDLQINSLFVWLLFNDVFCMIRMILAMEVLGHHSPLTRPLLFRAGVFTEMLITPVICYTGSVVSMGQKSTTASGMPVLSYYCCLGLVTMSLVEYLVFVLVALMRPCGCYREPQVQHQPQRQRRLVAIRVAAAQPPSTAPIMVQEEHPVVLNLTYSSWKPQAKDKDKEIQETEEKNEGVSSCPICLESFKVHDGVAQATCTHSYHIHCIFRWTMHKLNPVCPMCRSDLKFLPGVRIIG